MQTTRKLLLTAATLGLTASSAYSQLTSLVFQFRADSNANYRQTPTGTVFEGGTFSVTVDDGNAIFDGCSARLFYSPSIPCPLGATGFISKGVVNDPDLNGNGPYYSISEIRPAQLLLPFSPQTAFLESAPPSLLPRPLPGFVDKSITVFFNLQTRAINQFPLSAYDLTRGYTGSERSRFDGEVVPGSYTYNFASLRNASIPQILEINQFPMIDGFREVDKIEQGFRFLNSAFDEDGFVLLDPELINKLEWEGNDISVISARADNLFLSIKQLVNPNDPLSAPDLLADTLFPGFVTGRDSRIILPTPLATSYILPPNFVKPGETGLLDIEFVINRTTSPVIFESATRRFRIPVRVIDSFASSMRASTPPGTTEQQMSADFDFDGDGVSNFNEWAFGSSPTQKASVPSSPAVRKVSTSGAVLFSASGGTGTADALEYKVPKVKNPIPRLKYSIEYSQDLDKWDVIKSDDPAWILVDSLGELKATSSATNPRTGGFFRTKVEVAN